MSNKSIFGIILAVIIIGVLVVGYFWMKPQATTIVPGTISTTPTNAPANPASGTGNGNTRPNQPNISKLLTSPPDAKATPAQLNAFSKEVAAIGVASESLDVTRCDPYPNVIIVKAGKAINFTNADSISHIIANGNLFSVVVPANGQITGSLNASAGILGYSCDGTLVGFFLVTP